jgi:pyruvate,water dikinase
MAEFDFTLNDPADEKHTWTQDAVHAPDPMSPLAGQFASLVQHGLTTMMREYSIPIESTRYQVVNGYLYSTMVPMDLPDEDLAQRAKEAEGILTGIVPQVGTLWRETYLPEIRSLLDELASFDLDGAPLPELIAYWDRLFEVERRLFEIHFLILVPAMLAVSEFDEMYRSLMQTDDPHAAYRLLGGIDNKTLETGRALFELSRKAREQAEVMGVLASPVDSREVLSALQSTDSGRAFLDDLHAYLDEYGQRGDKWDASYPSWIEDPTPVVNNLKTYIQQETHPAAELSKAAEDAERLLDDMRTKLADEPMLPILEFLLAAAREGIVISEDHGFWIDFRGGHRFRMACLAFGRRFAEAGAVEAPDDVFFLHPDEVVETARSLGDLDRRDLVAQRKAELERCAALTPPPTIGAPETPNPVLEENPIARAFDKFFGRREASRDAAGAIEGNPGAPGIARGKARIIRTITDADRLEDGDVLVAETTSPPWTPLFAIASAVVCDTGGILSHAAVVAREYQIPAVLGCVDATRRIEDGQTIEVDGNRGVVRVVS